MSISFVTEPATLTVRRLNIRLPDAVWQQVDAIVADSKAGGAKINIEATISSMLEALVRQATGTAKRRGRKAQAGS
jgi:hypothetical protein